MDTQVHTCIVHGHTSTYMYMYMDTQVHTSPYMYMYMNTQVYTCTCMSEVRFVKECIHNFPAEH